ncbi:MAG TPA: PaaI family thioesterase [Haliea salexigens]|uniref:PaaI family thioesterase n=1 Tax=Haliea salexigens TaxID=287487 RepID=A0A3C1KME7_9GAMM|nr:PaaI family thioesterase [Haliea salexigens]MAA88007.1 PaaI family thioesterase [Haliea sp.]HAN27771.1 PaaI family thioesterase [Haliea salexigens]
MTKADKLKNANAHIPPCLQVLNGQLLDFDEAEGTAEMQFDVSEQFCHSINVVQGGNVTVMLDAAMSHALFMQQADVAALPTLELKVSFLEPTLAGRIIARGKVVKCGKSISFLEGSLINPAGQLAAVASATAKVVRHKRD